jgi:glutamate transport system permease protein
LGRRLTSSLGYDYIPVLTGVAVGYLVITLTAGLLLSLIERKVAIAR